MAGAVASAPPGFPVPTLAYTRDVCGAPTHFAFSAFANRVLLVVTQTGTFGTVIEARRDGAGADGGGGGGGAPGAPTYSATVLLGRRDEPLLPLCARRIVESGGLEVPLVLCLALREHSAAAVRAIADAVAADNVWGGGRRAAADGPVAGGRPRSEDGSEGGEGKAAATAGVAGLGLQ